MDEPGWAGGQRHWGELLPQGELQQAHGGKVLGGRSLGKLLPAAAGRFSCHADADDQDTGSRAEGCRGDEYGRHGGFSSFCQSNQKSYSPGHKPHRQGRKGRLPESEEIMLSTKNGMLVHHILL